MNFLYKITIWLFILTFTEIFCQKTSSQTKVVLEIEKNIAGGKLQEAVSQFRRIAQGRDLASFIATIYEHKIKDEMDRREKLSNLEKVLQFALLMPNCSDKAQSLETLLQLIDHEDDPKSLLLDEAIERGIAELSENTCRDFNQMLYKFMSLKNETFNRVDVVMQSWIDKIRKGDRTELDQYFNEHDLKAHLCYFITRAYAEEHISQLFEFVHELTPGTNQIIGYQCLHHLIIEYIHEESVVYMELLYAIRDLQRRIRGVRRDEQRYLDKFNEMVDNEILPLPKKLVWNSGSCTIKSLLVLEHLYVDSKTLDHERKYMFTWRGTGRAVNSNFQLEPVDNGAYYRIKSIALGEYLTAGNDLDNIRREVFSLPQRSEASNKWEIIPRDDGSYFTLRSIEHDEYLYTVFDRDAFDEERRTVGTWKMKGRTNGDNWIIEC